MAAWTNTVPQGVIGTGDAQVYDNPLPGQFAGQLQNLRRQQEQQAQQLAKSWRDNELTAADGFLWADQIAEPEKAYIDEGIKLRQQGIDPNGSSPEAFAFRNKRREIEAQRAFRKGIESQYTDAIKKINTNPDKYDPESIKTLNEWVANTKLTDAYNGNLMPPQLKERFDHDALLKTLKAPITHDKYVDPKTKLLIEKKSVNLPEAEKLLIGAYESTPDGQAVIRKVTGGLEYRDVKDFSSSYDENLKKAQDYYDGLGDVAKRQLANQGVVKGNAAYTDWARKIADRNTEAKRNLDTFVKNGVARMAPGPETLNSTLPYKDPNEMTEYQRQSLALSRQRENRLAAGDQAASNVEPAGSVPLYYGKGGTAVTTGENVVKIPIPKKNFVGATAIDLKTGRPTKLTKSSNDYEVVSVGNYPILTKDITIKHSDGTSETLKKGSLVQDGYATKYPQNVQKRPYIHVQEKVGSSTQDRLVDYDYMPKGLTKAQNEALGAFKPAKPTQTNSNETVTFTDGGVTYRIPKGKVDAFLKAKPKAKRQ